jgi:tight adherence protein B
MQFGTWLAATFAFLAVTLGTMSVVLLIELWRERRFNRTALEELRALGQDTEYTLGSGPDSLFRRLERSEVPWIRALAARVPQLRGVELALEQAGLTWGVQSLILASCGVGVATGLALLTLTGSVLAAVVGAGLGTSIPYMVLRRKRAKRMALFEEQLPETIDLMVRALRSGHPLTAALRMVAEEGQDPARMEFRRAFEEQRFGLPLEDSLLGMADRVQLVDVRILMTAILIQRNVGGNLAEIMNNIAYTIRERFKIRRQLRVYTAQGRLSGYVLSLLPVALGCAFYMLNPAYIMLLFTDPIGKGALVAAIVMQLLGFLWIRKIINVEI